MSKEINDKIMTKCTWKRSNCNNLTEDLVCDEHIKVLSKEIFKFMDNNN